MNLNQQSWKVGADSLRLKMSPHVKSPLQLNKLHFYWLFITTNGLSTWGGTCNFSLLNIFVRLWQFWLCVFISCILFVPLWLFVVMLRCLFVPHQVYLWTFYVCLFLFIYLYFSHRFGFTLHYLYNAVVTFGCSVWFKYCGDLMQREKSDLCLEPCWQWNLNRKSKQL